MTEAMKNILLMRTVFEIMKWLESVVILVSYGSVLFTSFGTDIILISINYSW